jgi:hypothetical protein
MLPDSTSVSLINDHQQKTDFSTFLDDGKIFLKIEHRFVLFDKDGCFMDPVEFKFSKTQNKAEVTNALANMIQKKKENGDDENHEAAEEEKEQKEESSV